MRGALGGAAAARPVRGADRRAAGPRGGPAARGGRGGAGRPGGAAGAGPDSRTYHVPTAHRLRGALDVEALRRAFEALIGRHEALRTVFPARDGVPYQEVLPASRFALPVDDLAALAPEERDREAARRAEQAAQERFDLARGPLLRARVLRLSDAEHILLLTLHHIISDGWSMAVLWREVAALYAAGLRGEVAELAPLPVQYVDYAAWLDRWLRGEVLQRLVGYWTEQLADAPVDLPLPYRGPRPAVATSRGGRIELGLGAEVARRLHALAHHHGATLFMALVAALRVLLARTMGQGDLCIGTVVANRDRREIEGLIGMFVNTIVLRGQVRGGDRFVDVLARERDLMLSAYAHAHAPFEQVVDALGLERRVDRMPLIQVMCVDQGDGGGTAPLAGLTSEPFRVDLEIEKFDLTVSTFERGGVHEIVVGYNADLFEHAAVAALAARYERLLTEIAERPEQAVSQLALLAPAERAALFEEPARSVAWQPRGPTVMAQIERWMAEAPGAPAILWHDTAISYGALDARSAALAALLRRRGLGPERTVAVIAERSPLQIIALVATLRAGGAHVPIGPELPDERIAWMVDETAPVAILCDGPPPAVLARHAAAVIRLDEPWPEPPDLPAPDDPVPAVSPDALAYIIYTSGSTGRPKGVMISRRSFEAQVHWIQGVCPLDARDRLFQLSSAMFDFSIEEMLWPLTVGGAVVLPRHRGELEPTYLAELATRHAATVVHFVPSLLRIVVDACQATPWTTIKHLICGGEALSLDLARACEAVFPGAAVQNPYGPTEATIIATCWRYQPDAEAVLIGHPVSCGSAACSWRAATSRGRG
ncbi:MAG: hypothetical protein E6J91_27600 [Deltaproteobacteria bacterium]|nr:MAG: hypothetical protein E6J91_27600 [Deltaproteobacteria bacterium]